MSFVSLISKENKNSAILDLLGRCAGVGLWSVQIHNGDPMHSRSAWKWSQEFRRLLGFEGDDTRGFPDKVESWTKRLHPDDTEKTLSSFTAFINDTSGNSRYDVQQRIKSKNNDYHWFRVVGGVACDTQGKPKQACGVLINIDRQKKSEEQTALLGEYAGVGLWDAILHEGDPMNPGSKWEWSPEFRRLLGFQGHDTEGFPNVVQSWSERLHPDDVKHTFEGFAACLRNEASQTSSQYRLKTKSNDYRWFQAVGGVTCDTSGIPMRVCGSLIDIHEQKMAEQAYKQKLTDLTHALEANVSVVADRASSSSSSVASAAEELSASISEMDPKIAKAADEIATAFKEAAQANTIIHSLEEAANQIGDIIDLIKDISSQTNLLALNATIEAARAGEVGKGFAVVATEVKELASQTAAATEDITRQVDSLQSKSKQALQAMDVIGGTMETIKSSSGELTQLLKEQRLSTGKIVEQLARTVEEIDNVSKVINTTIESAR
ncbi:MAG: chemotaxis protein [Acidobacteria bacterium]|nr:MAG: chemotaxis protein [Acidobacteriota bacterium]PIE91086.1 MAG: chemotaxis protein [Acidobacteriota bacterium]